MAPTASQIRAEARLALHEAILDAALGQLSRTGPEGLSVREVARQVGLASSAIYRHIPSRDALLTELIIRGYDELGAAVEKAESELARERPRQRFVAVGQALRTWALEHPQHWALLYGSPVPGYVAPEDTIGPATRVALVLAAILRDAAGTGSAAADEPTAGLEPELLATVLAGVEPELAATGILAWITIYGLVSFELFGHLVGSVVEPGRFFEHSLEELADRLELPR